LSDAFLVSGLAVRLVDRNPADGRRQPRCWSTAAHLALERYVLDRLAGLAAREQAATDPHKVEAAIANATRLGDDQAAAVRVLCGPGPAVRALVAPAGYGKTTTVQTASAAQQVAGRPSSPSRRPIKPSTTCARSG